MALYEAECPAAAAAATPEQRVKQAKVSRRQWLRSASHFAAALPLSLAGVSRLPGFDLGKVRQRSTSSAVPPPAPATQALATLFGGGLAIFASVVFVPGIAYLRPAQAFTTVFGILFGLPGVSCAWSN